MDATSSVQYLPRSAFDEALVVIVYDRLGPCSHPPMFFLIAGFLVSRGVNVKSDASCLVELVLVPICVNVLAVVGLCQVL